MRICLVAPAYRRHAESNPELADLLPLAGYLGAPTAAVPILAGMTPPEHELVFVDDRIEAVPFDEPFDLAALTVFTPAAARAVEIAEGFRAGGVPVVAGGLLPSVLPEALAPHVDAVCVGEGEPVWGEIVADAAAGRLRRVYRAAGPFDLGGLPPPRFDLLFAKEGPQGYHSVGAAGEITVDYPLQISRGCPLACPTCVLPAQAGSDIRFADRDWLADCFRALKHPAGRRYVALTEDTSALRVMGLGDAVAERLAACAGLGPRVSYVGASPAQVRTAAAGFFELLRRLETVSVYLVCGFDPLSRAAMAGADRRAEARFLAAVRRLGDEGLGVYASFAVGHDEHDEGVFDRVLELCRVAGIDTAEFAILTPYPGTPLWRQLNAEDRILTRDWWHYNDANPTFRPARLTPDRLRAGYLHLWREFYRDHPPRHAVQI